MRRSALFVLLLSLPLNAAATTIIALPEPELIRHSHAIVVATVIRTDTIVHPGGRVATHATVQVNRGIRGPESSQVIVIEVPGGRLSGLVAHVPGSPVMRGGDMIFGFLERAGDVFRPLGLSYGLLRVRKDAAGNYRVFRDTEGLSMMSPDGSGAVAPATVAIIDVPLEELIARVEKEMPEVNVPAEPGTVQP